MPPKGKGKGKAKAKSSPKEESPEAPVVLDLCDSDDDAAAAIAAVAAAERMEQQQLLMGGGGAASAAQALPMLPAAASNGAGGGHAGAGAFYPAVSSGLPTMVPWQGGAMPHGAQPMHQAAMMQYALHQHLMAQMQQQQQQQRQQQLLRQQQQWLQSQQPQQLQQQYQQAAAAAPAQALHACGRAAAAAAAATMHAQPAAAKRAAKTTRASKKRQRQVEQEEEEEDEERHFALNAAIPALNGNGAAAAAAAAAAGAFAYPRQLSAARGFGPGGARPVLNPYRRAADAAGANPGASPGSSAHGAVAAAAEARRGGGGGAQEVKEERDVNMWAPRDEEREALHWLLQMGFQSDEAVMGIRSVKERAAAAAAAAGAAAAAAGDGGGGGGGDDGGHDSDDERAANGAAQLIHGVRKAGMCDEETAGVVQQASRWLLRQRSIRWHSQQEDQTRLMRDHDLEHAAAMRAQSELALEAEGDILGAPLFASSTLLAEPADGGCAVLRRLLAAMEAGEFAPSCAMAALRESAVRLLLMEMRTLKWYNQASAMVRGYFCRVAARTDERCACSSGGSSGGGAAGKAASGKKRRSSSSSSSSAQQEDDAALQACADALTEELKSLEAIHARYPGTSMDVPREFRECAPRSTLEDDGIEEVELEAPSTGAAAAAQQAEGTAVAAAPPPLEIIELE